MVDVFVIKGNKLVKLGKHTRPSASVPKWGSYDEDPNRVFELISPRKEGGGTFGILDQSPKGRLKSNTLGDSNNFLSSFFY